VRFNELISGVRGDVAIKVYGDDQAAMKKPAQQILAALSAISGAADAKMKQTEELPVMTVETDRAAVARYGVSIHDVQTVVATAMRGAEAGQVFEGDRRFDLVVLLPDALRGKIDTLEKLSIPLPKSQDQSQVVRLARADSGIGKINQSEEMSFISLGQVARVEVAEGTNQISRENGKRRVMIQCRVRGRDLGSFVQEAQVKVNAIPLAAGLWASTKTSSPPRRGCAWSSRSASC